MKECVVGIGSNIEPEKHFKHLRKRLRHSFATPVFSQVIITKPIGYTNQADFSNGVVLLKVGGSLLEIKQELKNLENKLGRVRTNNKNAPRTIDLDILVWDGKVVDETVNKWPFWSELIREVVPWFEGRQEVKDKVY